MTAVDVAGCIVGAGCSFLLGSIPFGVLIAQAHGCDIRSVGSKNIGATNVWRQLGWRAGLLCFALDAIKGLVPALVAGWALGTLGRFDVPGLHATAWLVIGLASVVGHMFSPWVGFKGGKGVATGFGAVVGFFPWLTVPGLLALGAWMIVFALSRYVSLASLLAAVVLALSTPWVLEAARWIGLAARRGPGEPSGLLVALPFAICAAVLAGLVIVRHRGNIARLLAGTESKFKRVRSAAWRRGSAPPAQVM